MFLKITSRKFKKRKKTIERIQKDLKKSIPNFPN